MSKVSGNVVRRLMAKQFHLCAICRDFMHPGQSLHIDHITAIAKGGKHGEENMQLTHAKCNLSKAAS